MMRRTLLHKKEWQETVAKRVEPLLKFIYSIGANDETLSDGVARNCYIYKHL